MSIDFTPIARLFFRHTHTSRARWAVPSGAESTQRRLLAALLDKGAKTRYGAKYGFAHFSCYEDFARRVPVIEYEDIRSEAERMVFGERDILWPGVCRRFAQSSGTSGGKSKYIPVTDDSLRQNHYHGAAEAVASYLSLYPDSRLFSGKGFILGGSFANEIVSLPKGVKRRRPVGKPNRRHKPGGQLIPRARQTHGIDEQLARETAGAYQRLDKSEYYQHLGRTVVVSHGTARSYRRAGASTIHDVWPGLEVFFHGGIAFGPYREQYRAITDPAKMRYIENYNASEGFFAVQDTADGSNGMLLLLDHGVFYEFRELDGSDIVPAWKVEQGKTYALIISACNGLWRYLPGDTVRIESTEPLRISIAGRTSCFINAFGEELMVWNADAAITKACETTGAKVADYTAAPVYTSGRDKGHHQWLIEWATPPSCGSKALPRFSTKNCRTSTLIIRQNAAATSSSPASKSPMYRPEHSTAGLPRTANSAANTRYRASPTTGA